MRHRVGGKKLNRTSSHRKALNKFMSTSFLKKGEITTTEAKAKFIQPYVERLVEKAKKHDLSYLKASLSGRLVVDMLLNNVARKFAERHGGYTRIVKLGFRVGDAAPLAKLSWVEKIEVEKSEEDKKKLGGKKEVKEEKIVKPKRKVVKKEIHE